VGEIARRAFPGGKSAFVLFWFDLDLILLFDPPSWFDSKPTYALGLGPMANYKHTWDISTIPDEILIPEAGRRLNAKRKTRAGGHNGGRRFSEDRCPCGKMTRQRAEKRNHQCAAASKRGQPVQTGR
jgi:hypothetical protein